MKSNAWKIAALFTGSLTRTVFANEKIRDELQVSSCMMKVFSAVKEAELVPSVPQGATTAEGQRLWILLVSEASGCITDSSYTTLVMWYNQLQCLFYSWSFGALLWLNLAFEELSDTSIDFVGFRQSACEYCYSDVCQSFSFSLSLSLYTNMLLLYPVCETKIVSHLLKLWRSTIGDQEAGFLWALYKDHVDKNTPIFCSGRL